MAKRLSPQAVGPAPPGAARRDLPEAVPVGEVLREPGIQPLEKGATVEAEASMWRGAAGVHRRATSKKPAIRERERLVRRRGDRDYSVRRFGDKLSVVNSADYEPDNEMHFVDSSDRSISSSDKENVNPRRKRFLEDALFGFFRKEAIKSLKRDFSKICNDSTVWPKEKRLKERVIGRDDFSTYSTKYFWEVLKSLSNHRKDVITKFGFGCLLLFQKSEIPSAFVRWIASCIDPVSSQIIIDDCKFIPISKESVYHVTGLPNSGSVPMPDSDRGAKFILLFFGLTELPHITFFGNKLKSNEVMSDKEIFVCFIVVAFKCFLFPSMDGYPNTDFLHILEEPDSASKVDICLLVYENIMSGVSKFLKSCKLNGRKPRDFEFCYYILAVYYLDCLDFGARMLDQTVPRISIWNGNMIKFFSELDHRKKNIFGKRHLKKNLARCYKEFGVNEDSNFENIVSYGTFVSSCFSTGFKEKLHTQFGNALDVKIIDGIIDSVQAATLASVDNSSKYELCVNNVLHFLMASKSSEFKVPPSEANVLGADIRRSDIANSEDHINNNSKANTNVATKLEVIKPDFSRALGSNKSTPLHLESPECVISKPGESRTINTAPAMQPMKKVKSRCDNVLPPLKTFPAGAKDTMSFLYPDNSEEKELVNKFHYVGGYILPNINTSPISRINFSPSPNMKSYGLNASTKGGTMNANGMNKGPIIIDSSAKLQPDLTSPEVQITRSTSFCLRQVELAKDVDELYNNMANFSGNHGIQPSSSKNEALDKEDEYIDLSQHAVEERLSKNDLVILQPKNTLALPLPPNHRFPVSELEIKHFCAIVELAYTRGVQKSCAVMFSKVHCSFISLGQSLQREGHVDNFLIPLFCRKLFEDNHPSKSGRHHFFSFIGENILDFNNGVQLEMISKAFLGAASASKGKRLELADRLFFPICRSRHWFTFCVDFKYELFVFLDSLFGKEDNFHTSIKNVLIKNFVKIWKIVFKTEENMFKKYRVMYASVPKQDNADDCGVFTMKFMETFKPELDMRRLFNKDDIMHIRIQYANQLYFCTRNQVSKSLVIDFPS